MRARRLERRRKVFGSDNPSCFYCGESDVACLELEHPVGIEHDKEFTRIVCRNCHRKQEMRRDVAKLTKNGKRRAPEIDDELFLNYCMRFAEDLETSSESLRRKATLFAERKKIVRGAE
jgi:hypothetical protein